MNDSESNKRNRILNTRTDTILSYYTLQFSWIIKDLFFWVLLFIHNIIIFISFTYFLRIVEEKIILIKLLKLKIKKGKRKSNILIGLKYLEILFIIKNTINKIYFQWSKIKMNIKRHHRFPKIINKKERQNIFPNIINKKKEIIYSLIK